MIAAILSDDQMKEYDELAAKLGMDVLVEDVYKRQQYKTGDRKHGSAAFVG